MLKIKRKIDYFLYVIFFVCSVGHVYGEALPVNLKLISGGGAQGNFFAGLVIEIPEGWHVSAPTDKNKELIGFQPALTWQESTNLKSIKVLWPPGEKTIIEGQIIYAYQGRQVVPIHLTPLNAHQPIKLVVQVSLIACSKLCIPLEKTLELTIKKEAGSPEVLEALVKNEDIYEGTSLLSLLIFALLGGAILNFMPCVLPVLSLKVLSLVKQSKKTNISKTKHSFLITALGILTSFLCLALITVVLKESGQAIGWGIHFQNPLFLSTVFVILCLFAANLLGFFEIDLPLSWGDWLINHEGKGMIKDFLSGVFATLLATPCSAPFVGTAVSFALAHDNIDIFVIFLFLGFGFASPYFLAVSLPKKWIKLPRSGPWMLWFQRFLGVIIVLTAAWIALILSYHESVLSTLLSFILVLCVVGIFWLRQHKDFKLHILLLSVPLLFLAIFMPSLDQIFPSVDPATKYAQQSTNLEIWQPFDPSIISALVSQGKIVFVDVTAEWCVTCAVNKKLVLNSPRVSKLLALPQVIVMRADWTRQDPIISQFLKSYGRYGIPFNIIFGPKNPQGIPLSELLSQKEVLQAFESAGLNKEKGLN